MNPDGRPARLTARAKQLLAGVLSPGDIAVDATVGNGHDTLFLAQTVHPGGMVIGCDVQEAAITATRARLAAAGLDGIARLHLTGHERLAELVAPEHHGRVAAITFNLGYLPGGDKTLVTRAETTRAALQAAATLLRPGGLLSLLVYVGHPGGAAEHDAVRDWIDRMSAEFSVHAERRDAPGSPVLYALTRNAPNPRR
jgi:SAM-dependent methyltransferase